MVSRPKNRPQVPGKYPKRIGLGVPERVCEGPVEMGRRQQLLHLLPPYQPANILQPASRDRPTALKGQCHKIFYVVIFYPSTPFGSPDTTTDIFSILVIQIRSLTSQYTTTSRYTIQRQEKKFGPREMSNLDVRGVV